jgi:hypothetical protein
MASRRAPTMSMPTMPTMPSELVEDDDLENHDDEEDESQDDDGHMVALLEKLNSAKQNIDSSRNK